MSGTETNEYNESNETFQQLFEESLKQAPILPGTIVTANVERIEGKYVVVDTGLKSETYIPIEQFYDENGHLEVQPGESVKVVLEMLEDGFGNTRLSRERAKRLESWEKLEQAYQDKSFISGTIVGRVKGGFTVEINKVRAFLPGSLVDVKPMHHPEALEGKEFEFKVIKVDTKRNNIVVSRRAVLEGVSDETRALLLESIHEKDRRTGIVKNITNYGVFVDLGGVDGLLHITDISWKRIADPATMFKLGDEIDVIVLRVDRKNVRVSLGHKQLTVNPWISIAENYPVGTQLNGHVTNIADYGAFVEIEDGIEGLVHASEMDWTNKNVNPNKVVYLGQEVTVVVLNVDAERRRISLGMKQCTPNPWEAFAAKYQKRQQITGKIKSITDFGIFLELEGNIDGLVYLSDIAWNEEEAQEKLRQYQKGDELSVMILAIDVERERIALGLKQLGGDGLANFLAAHEKDATVSGTVAEVDAETAMIDLSDGVQGMLSVAEYSEIVQDLRTVLKPGDAIEAKILGMDRKLNLILLSCKKEVKETAATTTVVNVNASSKKAVAKSAAKPSKANHPIPSPTHKKKKTSSSSSSSSSSSEAGIKTTLGDLFKDHMR